MKKIILVVLILFAKDALAQDSWLGRIKEELLPTGKYLEPVLGLEFTALSNQDSLSRLEFKYTGEYKVKMVLYTTEQNKPPRTVPPAEFTLMGKMELVDDKDKTLFSKNFKTTVKNIHVGVTLAKFDIGRKSLSGEKIFKIHFQEISQDWGRYFSGARLYIQRNMKYGLLR